MIVPQSKCRTTDAQIKQLDMAMDQRHAIVSVVLVVGCVALRINSSISMRTICAISMDMICACLQGDHAYRLEDASAHDSHSSCHHDESSRGPLIYQGLPEHQQYLVVI